MDIVRVGGHFFCLCHYIERASCLIDDRTPSDSYFWRNITALSCIARPVDRVVSSLWKQSKRRELALCSDKYFPVCD